MKDLEHIKDMKGKTITSIEELKAEFGRTYDYYLCFVFSDNTRILLNGSTCYDPKPSIETMQKAPLFFTGEDFKKRIDENRAQNERGAKAEEERARREFEKIKKEYGW